jgi:hypothetical protein
MEIILQKALLLAQTPAERLAIARFAAYHVRLAAYTGLPLHVKSLRAVMQQAHLPLPTPWLWPLLARLPLRKLYALYTQIRN